MREQADFVLKAGRPRFFFSFFPTGCPRTCRRMVDRNKRLVFALSLEKTFFFFKLSLLFSSFFFLTFFSPLDGKLVG